MRTPQRISAAFLVAASIAVGGLGGVVFAPSAMAAEYIGEASPDGAYYTATLTDADMATLAAIGFDVSSITITDGFVRLHATQNEEVQAAIFPADIDPSTYAASYQENVTLQVIGSQYSYDSDKIVSPWAIGDVTSVGDLNALSTAYSTNEETNKITSITAHTSRRFGGTIPGTAQTWTTDSSEDMNEATANAISGAGLLGHDEATKSNGTDGTTGVYLQGFAKGEGTGQYEGLGKIAVAITEPIWVAIDTSHSNLGASGVEDRFATVDASAWSQDERGMPLAQVYHQGEEGAMVESWSYSGNLDSTSQTWFDWTPYNVNANRIFTNTTAMPDGTVGLAANSRQRGALPGNLYAGENPGDYTLFLDTSLGSPVLQDPDFGPLVDVVSSSSFGSMLIVNMRATDGSDITMGGEQAPAIAGDDDATRLPGHRGIGFYHNDAYVVDPPVITDPPVVTPEPEAPPVVTPEPEAPPVVTPEPEAPPVVTPEPEAPPVVTPEPEAPPVVTPEPETPVVTPEPQTPTAVLSPERFVAKTGIDSTNSANPVSMSAAGNTVVAASGLGGILIVLVAGFLGFLVRPTKSAKHRA
ncbi:hypothetical protein, partial [Rhodoglobus sp.]